MQCLDTYPALVLDYMKSTAMHILLNLYKIANNETLHTMMNVLQICSEHKDVIQIAKYLPVPLQQVSSPDSEV